MRWREDKKNTQQFPWGLEFWVQKFPDIVSQNNFCPSVAITQMLKLAE